MQVLILNHTKFANEIEENIANVCLESHSPSLYIGLSGLLSALNDKLSTPYRRLSRGAFNGIIVPRNEYTTDLRFFSTDS